MKYLSLVGFVALVLSCGGQNQNKTAQMVENEEQSKNIIEATGTTEGIPTRKMGCGFTVPQNIETISGAKVLTHNDMDILLTKGAAITFTGSNNVIFVTNGAAATIVGDGNFIYVLKGGATTISGTGNGVYAPKKAAILDDGEGTRIQVCKAVRLDLQDDVQDAFSKKSADAKPRLRKASSTMADPMNKAQELSGLMIDDAIPFDEKDHLVGSWTVDQARFNNTIIKTKGSINLYANGTGVQNYSVMLSTISIPQIAVFKWKRKGNTLQISADENSVWQLESTARNEHQVVIDLGDGVIAQLFLVRKN